MSVLSWWRDSTAVADISRVSEAATQTRWIFQPSTIYRAVQYEFPELENIRKQQTTANANHALVQYFASVSI